jgi:predicted 3-demethylubiquinone-9 3-methyltransferase (glyoxalase superfamily)
MIMASTTTQTSKTPENQAQPQKITTFLWFNDNAEEAANFYTSIFKNSKIRHITRYGDAGAGPKGKVMTVDFELDGQQFTALNGGPTFKFTEAISLLVHCQTQEEIDYFWEKLSEGGEKIQCGWLKDKYGLAWQITPDVLLEFLTDPDEKRKDRVMSAMMTMTKIEIEPLLEAAKG